jgi:tetratricopeptide (TPR) repeat protein
VERQQTNLQGLLHADLNLGRGLLEAYTLDQAPAFCDWNEAERALAEAIEISQLMRETEGNLDGRSYLAMVYTDQGQFGQARDLLAEARAATKDWLFPPVETALIWAEARLAAAEERWAEALITFESLVESCAQYDMRWARARILIDWAAAHASRGGAADLSSARSLLQESHTMFQEMGISRYAELIQERLSVLSSEA